MNAEDILKKIWGHSTFRLQQEKIINQVIRKKDTLALLPTGGGKSICYQIPALMQEGICLVISPLIALMNDQVGFLSSKGIKSLAITSEMNYHDIENTLTNCIYGNVKFLYLSPERLRSKLVKDKLDKMKINLITIDEAHCISEWGHNFRPSYRNISDIKSICKNPPMLALTATATLNVINDIQNNLKFKEHNLIRSSFFRRNLSYVVDPTQDKKSRLLKLVDKIKSSVIVYVSSRKEAQDISAFLISNNYSAHYYHAGVAHHKRKKIQKEWTNNETRIIVATNAFGMGINKDNVKLVVHMYLPTTIESYFQEAGRAGRNGEQAYSFLLANKQDIKKQEKILELRYPKINEIKEVYQNLANSLQVAENSLPKDAFKFDIIEFSKKYNITTIKLYNVLQYLQKEEYIQLTNNLYSPSKIKIIISKTELYRFQISNQYYDNFIRILLRKYTNIFNNFIIINENEIAKTSSINTSEVIRILKKLEQLEIIIYRAENDSDQITFLKERVDARNLSLNEKKWKERKDNDQKKINSIVNFILCSDRCRSSMLLDYFSEKNIKDCNKCDYCVKEKRKLLKSKEFNNILVAIKNNITNKELSLQELCNLIPEFKQEKISESLEFLFNNDQVIKFGNKYQWKINDQN